MHRSGTSNFEVHGSAGAVHWELGLENFWEEYPRLVREEVRSALGSFLFSQEEVEKKMGQLSGGERVRLALCKMFQTRPNLLILDELSYISFNRVNNDSNFLSRITNHYEIYIRKQALS